MAIGAMQEFQTLMSIILSVLAKAATHDVLILMVDVLRSLRGKIEAPWLK